jgi:hypothetical protein
MGVYKVKARPWPVYWRRRSEGNSTKNVVNLVKKDTLGVIAQRLNSDNAIDLTCLAISLRNY